MNVFFTDDTGTLRSRTLQQVGEEKRVCVVENAVAAQETRVERDRLGASHAAATSRAARTLTLRHSPSSALVDRDGRRERAQSGDTAPHHGPPPQHHLQRG